MTGSYDQTKLSPLRIVLIAVLMATVAGSCLLLSASESLTRPDGAIEWGVQSSLRALVQLLCLNYEFPTIYAGDVKTYILGMGAGLAAIALGIGIAVGSRLGNGSIAFSTVPDQWPEKEAPHDENQHDKVHLTPLVAAQLLAVLYLIWSFISSRWSSAPSLAIGGSLLLTCYFLWSFVLGLGLNTAATRVVARTVVLITGISAVVALAYYYGRNPELRAKFPFGNPNFLAACLIPGMLIALAWFTDRITHLRGGHRGRSLVWALVCLVALGLMSWAFGLSESRGPALGLAAGLAALIFFSGRKKLKTTAVLMSAILLLGSWFYFNSIRDASSPTGRSETIRFRTYAWSYAWKLFMDKPLTGYGQGGFATHGDAQAINDVLDDPMVLESRVARAHNEWLEVLTDLGSVGIVLILGAIGLTLWAGLLTLEEMIPGTDRWILCGLLASLTALCVEEAFGVGLRVSGVPTLFFTVLGLIWTMAARSGNKVLEWLAVSKVRRLSSGAAAVVLGLMAVMVSHLDFADARTAYHAREALREGRFEDAIVALDDASFRMNPQRSLEQLYRTAEAHMYMARSLQTQAIEREMNASQIEMPDLQQLDLARQVRQRSDQYCRLGSRSLRMLLERSPDFYNHGWLAYWFNWVLAGNADARGDEHQRDQFLAEALASLERELHRQPFNPQLAVEFGQAATGLIEMEKVVEVLARPLRYHSVAGPYVQWLTRLASYQKLKDAFDKQVAKARLNTQTVIKTGDNESHKNNSYGNDLRDEDPRQEDSVEPNQDQDDPTKHWGPEILRMAGALGLISGDYAWSLDLMELAAQRYDQMVTGTHLGAAACYAELADCRMAAHPWKPGEAIEAAKRAIELAPRSERGRTLVRNVKERMVVYLLANGDESAAKTLIQENRSPKLADEVITRRLGTSYRYLCASFIRSLTPQMRSQHPELAEHLHRWSTKDLEFNVTEILPYLTAAELALRMDQYDAAVRQIRTAQARGAAAEDIAAFIEYAKQSDLWCDGLTEFEINQNHDKNNEVKPANTDKVNGNDE